jgi:hypothetical protein
MDPSHQFETITQLLDRLDIDCEAYEFHGVATALITRFPGDAASQWLELFKLSADPQDLLQQESIAQLNNELDLISNSLNDELLGFQPLIADDEEPLTERVYSLASWCQGYLLGLNYQDNHWIEEQSSEFQEMVDDLMGISQIESYQLQEGEEDEHSLFEIVEYVKAGVLFIHGTIHTLENGYQLQPTIH